MFQKNLMRAFIGCVSLALLAACAGMSGTQSGHAQRLYVFNCGDSTVEDMSRWTPGANIGQPGSFSANCYLIQHAKGLMMWDSGINDSVATMPKGFQRGKLAPRYVLRKPLRFQLEELGIEPGRITHVAFSHTHGDHVGNANLFAGATLYIQQAEYDAAFGPDAATKWKFRSDELRQAALEQDGEAERRP